MTGRDTDQGLESTDGPDDDPHFFVVNGRRWRRTDPGIPEKLRAELVSELMSARRAVKEQSPLARPRVQDAKVSLGERGDPWWEDPTADGLDERLAATMRALLRNRQATSTICPSDAARVVAGEGFRTRMDDARRVAAALRDAGVVRTTQKGADVDPLGAHGPVRIARGPKWTG